MLINFLVSKNSFNKESSVSRTVRLSYGRSISSRPSHSPAPSALPPLPSTFNFAVQRRSVSTPVSIANALDFNSPTPNSSISIDNHPTVSTPSLARSPSNSVITIKARRITPPRKGPPATITATTQALADSPIMFDGSDDHNYDDSADDLDEEEDDSDLEDLEDATFSIQTAHRLPVDSPKSITTSAALSRAQSSSSLSAFSLNNSTEDEQGAESAEKGGVGAEVVSVIETATPVEIEEEEIIQPVLNFTSADEFMALITTSERQILSPFQSPPSLADTTDESSSISDDTPSTNDTSDDYGSPPLDNDNVDIDSSSLVSINNAVSPVLFSKNDETRLRNAERQAAKALKLSRRLAAAAKEREDHELRDREQVDAVRMKRLEQRNRRNGVSSAPAQAKSEVPDLGVNLAKSWRRSFTADEETPGKIGLQSSEAMDDC